MGGVAGGWLLPASVGCIAGVGVPLPGARPLWGSTGAHAGRTRRRALALRYVRAPRGLGRAAGGARLAAVCGPASQLLQRDGATGRHVVVLIPLISASPRVWEETSGRGSAGGADMRSALIQDLECLVWRVVKFSIVFQ